MGKIRQQNSHVTSRRGRPFFFKERRVTARELAENGAPTRGVLTYLFTGLPPAEGTGRHSTVNAAERVKRSASRHERA